MIPGTRDVSLYRAFQFRVGVNFADARNKRGTPAVGIEQNLTLTLADEDGNANSVRVGDFSRALYFPPGQVDPYPAIGGAEDTRRGAVPHLLLNAARIPLAAFPDVDLSRIERIYFRFNDPDRGALLLCDIQFTD